MRTSVPELRELSFGVGVQPSRLLTVSAIGRFPKIDFAVCADTGRGSCAVDAYLDHQEDRCARAAGISILQVLAGDHRDDYAITA